LLFFDRKPAAADPWTKAVWVYDLRTNMHFTLKTKPLRESDLDGFVAAYSPADRSARVESERFRRFSYDEVIARDKANLDITWLRDDTLDDGSTLPPPAVLAAEIVEELESALAQFTELAATLPPLDSDTS
jgi:type I restriction enzyme M protein